MRASTACSPDPNRQAARQTTASIRFAQPPAEFFPHVPFHYEVRVAQLGVDRLEISARGYGPLGATRMVVASVLRGLDPYLPAALSLAARDATLALGAGFRVAGVEPRSDDPGLPAVALDGPEAAAALAARLAPGAGAQLVGRGGSPSIAGAALPSAESIADAAARRADAQPLGGEARGRLGDGLFVTPTSLRLADVEGSGVLVVGGTLELSGTISFAGLIVALGDVRLDASSTAAIDGAVMVGSVGAQVSLRGAGHLAYDPLIIARIDAQFPGLLPRRARVTGWREQPDAAL
jgi:hypothetical protein